MLYLIIYDITDNSLRNKLADILKDFGLDRIQYSAFIGTLKRHELNSLIARIKKLLASKEFKEGERVRNVQIYPIPNYSKERRTEISYDGKKLYIMHGYKGYEDKVVFI